MGFSQGNQCRLEALRMLGHPLVRKHRSALADFPVPPLEYWKELFVEEGAPDL